MTAPWVSDPAVKAALDSVWLAIRASRSISEISTALVTLCEKVDAARVAVLGDERPEADELRRAVLRLRFHDGDGVAWVRRDDVIHAIYSPAPRSAVSREELAKALAVGAMKASSGISDFVALEAADHLLSTYSVSTKTRTE